MNICLFTSEEINLPLDLNDSRAQHIVKVLKKKSGDTFDAGIIGGSAGVATITSLSGGLSFSFEPKSSGKPLYPLTLIVGFPRPIQLRRLFRDAAGLGVQKIILCGTELTEKSYLNSNIVTDGSAERMLLDGTVQAASTHVPILRVEKSLKDAVAAVKEDAELKRAALVALDNKKMSMSLGEFLRSESAPSAVAAIGSERGWTDKERSLLEQFGFTLCSMGNRILRTETAATVAASLILDSMGFLD